MSLPHDLKDYRADDDLGAFQILTPDAAVLILCAMAVLALIFSPYIN